MEGKKKGECEEGMKGGSGKERNVGTGKRRAGRKEGRKQEGGRVGKTEK